MTDKEIRDRWQILALNCICDKQDCRDCSLAQYRGEDEEDICYCDCHIEPIDDPIGDYSD